MTETPVSAEPQIAARGHVALHLAHRWFAFFEAPGGDLDAHLMMFHPQVRLSGNRGSHLFARDHASLVEWFSAIPDAVSSHHIVHSSYSTADNGDGLLNLVVAYQAPGNPDMHGSIISYETRIEYASGTPRFSSLDKTPILPNKRLDYETSWSVNRVLSWVHAELGGITESDGQLRAALGNDVRQVCAQATAAEGSDGYSAIVTAVGGHPMGVRGVRLEFADDVRTIMPAVTKIELLAT